jgi:5-methylcytosine-specific restriction endonuclease McrA
MSKRQHTTTIRAPIQRHNQGFAFLEKDMELETKVIIAKKRLQSAILRLKDAERKPVIKKELKAARRSVRALKRNLSSIEIRLARKHNKVCSSDGFYNSSEWRALRYSAFELHGNSCCCCGKSPKDGVVMHVDHIKPRSLFPELALELNNLQILCEECNLGKSNRFATDWR